MDDWYDVGAWITGVIVFVAIWGYCAAAYGFLGFALGWMPAMLLAGIIGAIWPLIAMLIGIAVLVLVVMMNR